MSDDGLNVILQKMQQSGELDSSGVFTISADQAKEKLRLFQLPEPRDYVLNVLSSAVLGKAGKLELKVDNGSTSIRYDGEPLDERQMIGLLNQLLNPTEKRLQELGVALNAVRTLNPLAVSLDSWSGESGWRLEMVGDKLTVLELKKAPWESALPENCLQMREGFKVRRAAQRWWSVLPEQAALERSCKFAPLALKFNELSLNEEIRIGSASPSCLAWLHLKPSEKWLEVIPPDVEWSPGCLVLEPETAPPDLEAIICLDLPTEAEKEGLLLLLNGVGFPRPAALLQVPFAHGVISTALLDKNVSHTDIAENPSYQALLKKLSVLCEALLVRRLESDLPLPESSIKPLLEWSPELLRRLESRGDSRSARSVALWVKETRFMLNLESDDAWLPVREELERLGSSPEGIKLAQRVAQSLLKASLLTLEAGSYLGCRKYCSRLWELAQIRKADWLSTARETTRILSGLCGEDMDDYGALGREAKGWMLRIQGHPEAALKIHEDSLARGETFLAKGNFEEAESFLRLALEEGKKERSLEALSDCLAFNPKSDRAKRREALSLREQAVSLRERSGFSWGSFLKDDLAELAGAVAPLHTYISHRVAASWAGRSASQAARGVEDKLTKARESLRQGASGVVRLKSALLNAERIFPLTHPFLDATRSRAVFRLRKNGLWSEADDIVARGRLLLHLHHRFHSDWLA